MKNILYPKMAIFAFGLRLTPNDLLLFYFIRYTVKTAA